MAIISDTKLGPGKILKDMRYETVSLPPINDLNDMEQGTVSKQECILV